ncbi:MAG: HD-GYP domain-containing protein [Desulfurivibrionaceae bacterium]
MAAIDSRGQQLLIALNSLLRTVRIHDDTNRQAVECAANFVDAVSAICGRGGEEFILQISNGRFFLDDEKILHGRNAETLIQVMLDYFGERKLSGFIFSPDIYTSNHPDILLFARMVNQAAEQKDPAPWLKKVLDEKDFSWVEPFEPEQATGGPEAVEREAGDAASGEEARRDHARKIYSYGLDNLKEVARKLAGGQRAGIKKSVRLVQNLVNILDDDAPVMLGLSTLRIYDDETYSHSVNVALLAMCIGRKIGLSRGALEKLGLAALFHDLGKVSIPQAITKKPNGLTRREKVIMRSHPLHSVRQILMLRAPHSRKAQIVLPAFEHHMKFDLTGYPKASSWHISLFGRIITIADVFDAITSPRVYRKSFLSPDRALGFMIQLAGKDFDPIILKVFINMLGLYPPGTVVELDSDELGLVIETPATNRKGLPVILLLKGDADKGYRKGEIVDLAERSPDSGQYLRKIVNTAHPAAYNIQPVQFIF